MDYTVHTPESKTLPVRNIYCVGRNYGSHISELQNEIPSEPVLFQKSIPALNTGSVIHLPPHRTIQHELEIVVLIGQSTDSVPSGKEMDFITGLALGLDLTDREFQSKLKEKRLPWLMSKSFKGSAVVTEFLEPDSRLWDEDFWLEKNGSVIQKGNRRDMVFPLPELIQYLASHLPLLEGDLLFTGTPEGVGTLSSGDRCRLGVGSRTLAVYTVQ
jgi:2-keto-4-pentenoate hydratase/2-oxohepta-3-ene-1,7-dioic acid hydratase in catechol pathway